MKSIAFFLLFLGLVSLSIASTSIFLDDLFVSPTFDSMDSALINCSATDTCVGKGDTCAGNYALGLGCSRTNGTCCAVGLFCNANKTCVTDTYEASCNAASDCYPPGQFTCANKTCQYIMGVGDECTDNSLCYSGSCINGTCQGQKENGACQSILNCNFGLFCKQTGLGNSTCQNTTAQGAACTPGGVPCYPGNVCYSKSTPANYTCQAVGTQTAGGPCLATADCGSGLVCVTSGGNTTCTSVSTSTVACTANANCTNGLCVCSMVTGSSYCSGALYNNPCTDESLSLTECLASNSCPMLSEAPDSCAQQKCSSDYKKANSCSCSLSNSILGKCFYNQYCGGFPVWAIIVIIVVAIVLVLAIVLLVFFMMRRRRQYDSI